MDKIVRRTINELKNNKKTLINQARKYTVVSQNKRTDKDDEIIYKENWKRRCELATAYRALEKLGMTEGICNHLTAKAPSIYHNDMVALIVPYGLYWADVKPEDLVGIDLDKGNVVEGNGSSDIVAHSIHRGIYRFRKDVNSVMHTHPPYSTVLGVLEDPTLKMIHQNSCRFLRNVTYDTEFEGLANDDLNEEAERLGKIISDKEVFLMGNHGLLTTGHSIAKAFDLHLYFEKAAQVQIMAYQTGQPLRVLPDHVVEQTYKDFKAPYSNVWSNGCLMGYMNTLRREDPSFIKDYDYTYNHEEEVRKYSA